MDRRPWLLVARQAGTAASFAPLLPLLAQRCGYHAYAYPPAAAIWSQEAIDFRPISTPRDAFHDQAATPPRLVLTGTSFQASEDCQWWRLAARQGIPAIAFVDQWSNYRARFTPPGGPAFSVLPWRIAVIDSAMQSDLIQCGVPAEKILITGTALFDRWRNLSSARIEATRQGLLREAGLQQAKLVLWALEPPDIDGTGAIRHEEQHRREAAALGEALAQSCREPTILAMRPHPIQLAAGETLPAPLGLPRSIRVVQTQSDTRVLAMAADVVVGRSTMLLVEAAVAGRPVISLRLFAGSSKTALRHPAVCQVSSVAELAAAMMTQLARNSGAPTVPGQSHALAFIETLAAVTP